MNKKFRFTIAILTILAVMFGVGVTVAYLVASSKPVNGTDDIARVGTVSSADEKVGRLIADAMEKVTADGVITVEESKTAETYLSILNFLAENRITRSDMIIALGGGVVGDIAGFAASCYLRGVDFIQIPTTVLAMVDSSVGGKTAINLKAGKNLCGAFYQPIAVYADCETLNTLPEETFNEGCAEIIKYGMICDNDFLDFLQNNSIKDNIEYVIKRCVEIKRDIVNRDEFENGERKLLNFGHTIGHAIEKCSNLSIPHGNAVAIGMAIATKGAFEIGVSDEDFSDILLSILKKNKLPTTCDFSAEELYKASLSDKKRSFDTMSIIVPDKLGVCKIVKLPVEDLQNFIEKGMN